MSCYYKSMQNAFDKGEYTPDGMVRTRVIFKKYHGIEDVVACLLDVDANRWMVVVYEHVGQHSEASISFCASCKSATLEEYADLKEELESLGYILTVRKKFPSGHNC